MQEKPSYYAVIPAPVRYDSELPDGAKLLYGEITALCEQQGFCWASNAYFGRLYNKSVDTISRWIADLSNRGYITTQVDNAAGNSRKIWIQGASALSAKMQGGIRKNADRYPQKNRNPIRKNADIILKENTTINESVSAHTPAAKSADLKTEIPTVKNDVPPPPAPGGWQPVDPTDEIEVMRADDLCKERFVRVERLPLERYGAMLDNFLLKVRSEQHSHNNRRDFRNHFFSWARLTGGHAGQANTAGQPVNPVRPGGIPKNVPVYGS